MNEKGNVTVRKFISKKWLHNAKDRILLGGKVQMKKVDLK